MEDDACDDPCETAVLQGQHGWAGRSAGRHGRHIRLHIQVPAQGQRLRGRACASYRPEGARAIEERVRGAQEEVSSRQSHPCIYPPPTPFALDTCYTCYTLHYAKVYMTLVV